MLHALTAKQFRTPALCGAGADLNLEIHSNLVHSFRRCPGNLLLGSQLNIFISPLSLSPSLFFLGSSGALPAAILSFHFLSFLIPNIDCLFQTMRVCTGSKSSPRCI
jgi:hypothetical protein